jgi:hypothetical protein
MELPVAAVTPIMKLLVVVLTFMGRFMGPVHGKDLHGPRAYAEEAGDEPPRT